MMTMIPAAHAEPAAQASNAQGEIIDIARWNDGLGNRYRTPGLAVATNGDLIAVFDSRPSMNDLPANIGTVMRRSTDGGRTCGPIQAIRAEAAPNGFGDPSILVDRETGRIFVFQAASINQGFAGSSTGRSNDDPNVQHADVSYSDDHGLTWHHRRLTADVKKDGWGGLFAASGEGIQLRHGPNAGRLIQQYTVRANGGNYAVSFYSDDHGDTWQTGALVGPGADENKVVELSDGSIMLNMRAGGSRLTAISTDGGETFSALKRDPQQVDPASNGTVARIYPEATGDDPRAKMVMLVNAEDSGIRRNTVAKVSCDDGQTWSGRHTIDLDASAYISTTPLGDGKMGVIYERDGYSKISYTSIDTTAMGMTCSPISAPASLTLTAGTEQNVSMTVTNQSQTDNEAGTISVAPREPTIDNQSTPVGLVDVPAIPAGGSVTVEVPVTLPAGIAGARTLDATYETGGLTSHTMVFPQVTSSGSSNPDISIEPFIDATYTGGADGLVGDLSVPWVRVTNSGNVNLTNIVVTSSTGERGCTVASLAPGQNTICRDRQSMGRTLTQADIDRGSWAPVWKATTAQGVSDEVAMTPLDLTATPASPGGNAVVSVPTGDFQSSSFMRRGTKVQEGFKLPSGHPLGVVLPRGGRTSAQLVVNSPVAGQLEVTVDGAGLDWTVQYPEFMSYVIKNNVSAPATPAGVVEDPIRTEAPVLSTGENQPVWFTIEAPSDLDPKTYDATIRVKVAGNVVGTYPVTQHVRNARLMPLEDRPITLDLWYHPDMVAHYADVPLWSEEHFAALKPYLEDLASRGQRVVNAAVVDDPWLVDHMGQVHPQTAGHYDSTITWMWDGSKFSFDFTVFDRLVEMHEEAGITGPIHVFAMLQFRLGERLSYVDTRTGQKVVEEVALAGPRYREAWGAFLNAFADHLESKGWFERTSLAFDERPRSFMDQAFAVINDEAPRWKDKTALAANSLAEADIANYISFNYSFLNQVPASLIESRLAAGEPTLFYTWNEPTYPNTVTGSTPMSARAIGWVVEKYNLDGYLRWTYNSWPMDVFNEPTFRYGQGDEYIIYPGENGPISSLRWEGLRDGWDDAEILRLAKDSVGADSAEMKRILNLVIPEAHDTPKAWSSMVSARMEALDLIGPIARTEITARVVPSNAAVTPEKAQDLAVLITAPSDRPSGALTVSADVPEGWAVLPGEVNLQSLPAGELGRVIFRIQNTTGVGTAEVVVTVRDAQGNVVATTTSTLTGSLCAPVAIPTYSADSQNAPEADGITNTIDAAFDGNPSTYWHTQWAPYETQPPHWVVMNPAEVTELCSFTYLPRQGRANGRIAEYRIYVSDTDTPGNGDWGAPVATGTFPNGDALQTVTFPEGTTAKSVKFEAVRMHNSQIGAPNPPFSSAAELGLASVTEPAKLTEPTQPTNPVADVEVSPEAPVFDPATGVLEVPSVTGVEYSIDGEVVTGPITVGPGQSVSVTASALEGYVLSGQAEWTFTADDRANLDGLEKAIADGLAIDRGRYTPATVKVLDEAITAGQAVLADKGAAQAEVDATEKAIRDAIAGLADKPVEPVPAPTKGNLFFFVNNWTSTIAHVVTNFGREGDEVLVGDWDGDGKDTLALRRGNTFYIMNSLSSGRADHEFTFGQLTDDVLVGDWNGDGKDTIALRRGNTYYLSNTLGGKAETFFMYGRATDEVFVGDWDGNGTDTFGLRRGNVMFVKNSLGGGLADVEFTFGRDTDALMTGDFDGDGKDTIAVRRGNVYYISNTLRGGNADTFLPYGRANDVSYLGDWDGNGTDTLVVNRYVK